MKFNDFRKYRRFLFRYRLRIISVTVFIIAAIVGSVFIYSHTSSFFMTPIESVIGKSYDNLKENYDKMTLEYELLDSVVNNIMERDKIVYNQLFGNDLVTDHYGDKATAMDKRFGELQDLSFSELADILIKESDDLKSSVTKVSSMMAQGSSMVKKRSVAFKSIPSMQPINNGDLSKSITPTGMRINPFVKSFFMHKGIDYSIPEETRVYATADGVVRNVLVSGKQGGTITLDHRNNYNTVYGNLSKTVVSQGATVKRGAIIGYSGNTGTSFLPHLHYEVKYRGKNLDPLDFFFGELSLAQIEKLRVESAQNIQSFD